MTSSKIKEFQHYISDYATWEDTLQECKLNATFLIVDVHCTWAGPCKAIVPAFLKIYLERAEQVAVKFCVVDAEKMLDEMRRSNEQIKYVGDEGALDDDTRRERWLQVMDQIAGQCMPQFLFYAVIFLTLYLHNLLKKGKFIKCIHGLNIPVIVKLINEVIDQMVQQPDVRILPLLNNVLF